MKKILAIFAISLSISSCVQKSYEQTVVVELDVSAVKNIQTVGIRGQNPLSWDTDLPMKEVVKDSLYAVTISGKTGYLFTEIKFTVNGEFELQNQPNRKIVFDKGRKTIYKATFNQL